MNIISIHHFLEIKTQGESDLVRHKCSLVPHSNHDDETADILTTDATAKFPIIRFLVSHTSIHGKKLVCVDINISFLKALVFQRDVFVKPPPVRLAHRVYIGNSQTYLWARGFSSVMATDHLVVSVCVCFSIVPFIPQRFYSQRGTKPQLRYVIQRS